MGPLARRMNSIPRCAWTTGVFLLGASGLPRVAPAEIRTFRRRITSEARKLRQTVCRFLRRRAWEGSDSVAEFDAKAMVAVGGARRCEGVEGRRESAVPHRMDGHAKGL